MQIQMQQLELFSKVAKLNSITKAAGEEYMTASSVIRQINSLEQALGFKLLNRSNRGVSLTEAGKAFYGDSMDIIARVKAAVSRGEQISSGSARSLKIGVMNIEQTLIDACQSYSSTDNPAQVQCVYIPARDKHQALVGRDIDFYWRADFPPSEDDVDYQVLYRSRLMLMMNSAHRLAKLDTVEWSDLYGERLILSPKGFKSYDDELRSYLEERHPQIVLIDTLDSMSNILTVGMGETVMVTTQLQRLPNESLCLRPVCYESWPVPLDIVAVYRKSPDNSVREFARCLKNVIWRRMDDDMVRWQHA